MNGTYHVQVTAQFLLCINLRTFDIRRLSDHPEFQTRTIPFGRIKLKTDPYNVLKIFCDPVNYLIE